MWGSRTLGAPAAEALDDLLGVAHYNAFYGIDCRQPYLIATPFRTHSHQETVCPRLCSGAAARVLPYSE